MLHELQSDRWRLQTLQDWRWNPLLYTRTAGDALYNLLARDFAPAPERLRNLGKRLNEMIPALRELWSGGWVSWSGQYYQVPELMIEPHPETPVPMEPEVRKLKYLLESLV